MTERYRSIGQGGRPVVNTSTTTVVYFGLGLISMELDEREKILESSMWVKMVSIYGYMIIQLYHFCKI